jgi:hypothetical protein
VQERLGIRRAGPARGEGAAGGRGKRVRDEARGLPRPHLIGPAEGAFMSASRLVVFLSGYNERAILPVLIQTSKHYFVMGFVAWETETGMRTTDIYLCVALCSGRRR